VTATVTASTGEAYSAAFAELVFNSTNLLKVFGIRGSNEMNGSQALGGNVMGTKNAIRFDNGFQFSGRVATTAPAASLLVKGGTVNAQSSDPFIGWAYDWQRIVVPMTMAEEDVQDNSGEQKLANLLSDEFKLGGGTMAKSVNDFFLGPAASLDATVGLPYMVSVTQTGSIGGISRTNSYWQNWHRDVGDPGGGGEDDKPLALKRALDGGFVGTSGYSSVSGPDLLVSNEGAYLTLGRMAESLRGYVETTKVEEALFSVGVPHMMVNGKPMIFDKAATLPWGGTAGDFIYGLSTEVIGFAFKSQEYMRVEEWVPPNARSLTRNYRSNLFTRLVPFIRDRRNCFVLHGITANTDATSD
jgi:hypothetical protein